MSAELVYRLRGYDRRNWYYQRLIRYQSLALGDRTADEDGSLAAEPGPPTSGLLAMMRKAQNRAHGIAEPPAPAPAEPAEGAAATTAGDAARPDAADAEDAETALAAHNLLKARGQRLRTIEAVPRFHPARGENGDRSLAFAPRSLTKIQLRVEGTEDMEHSVTHL